MDSRTPQDELRQFQSKTFRGRDISQMPIQPAVYHGTIPTDAYQRIEQLETDLLEERLEAYAREEIKILGIHPDFAKVPDIVSDTKMSRHDFPDDAYIDAPAIDAISLKDSEVAELGRHVMPMYSAGFSKSGAAALFILAHHTKTPGSDYAEKLFEDIERLNRMTDTPYHKFSDEYMVINGRHERIAPSSDESREAAFYSYMAASTMRLFTKSPGNFLKAWDHIISGFSKFYGDSANVRLPTASESAIESLANFLAVEERMRMSLYRFLYVANKREYHEGFKRYMYDMHLSNTGLHIVSIFAGLVSVLHCPPNLILTALYSPLYSAQLKALVKFIDLMSTEDSLHERRMWRYGRLFDDSFMSELQTKRCPILVYILAAALQLEAPETHKDILKITQLGDVKGDNQRKAKKVAEKFLTMVKGYMTSKDGTGLMKIFG